MGKKSDKIRSGVETIVKIATVVATIGSTILTTLPKGK